MKTSRVVLIAVLATCFPAFVGAVPLCTPAMPVNDYVSLGGQHFLCASDNQFDSQADNQFDSQAKDGTGAFVQTAAAGNLFGDHSPVGVQAFDVPSDLPAGEAITLQPEMLVDSNTGLLAVSEQLSVNFVVSEPTSMLLLGWGFLGLVRRHKRK